MSNRLAAEHSPYLLQHADNPVDWRPWSDEAFDAARAADKPIFLSIGYSTCHWCHVMAHESFENDAIAAVLNRDFIPIKVDREERPDVDRVYMTFVQATTGSGGWPMSVFLTPDLKPFFGGTYFPPDSRWGRPGFVDVLTEIGRAWREERPRIDQIADTLTARLKEIAGATAASAERSVPGPDTLAQGVREYAATFDPQFGGFGTAPKFPRPSELLFLMREAARAGDERATQMTLDTLRVMAFGGMRDHVGGGFHRYSVDREWRVPHFEKMLYDQAQLALAYLEAAQLTGEAFYAVVAQDTLEYVRREMTDEQGGFYSAEDADSVPPDEAGRPNAHKTEGAFYLWTSAEIDSLLGDDAEVVRLRFGVQASGNAPEDPHGEFAGKNLLYTAAAVEEIAARTGRTADAVVDVLARARVRMFTARAGRPRPHLDDKVLTAWNGLMIAAFARAARVRADNPRAARDLEAARRAATFLRSTMWRDGVLFRSYRNGHAGIEGYCEDYACLIAGLLELFQADGDPSWLSWAIELQRAQDARFWDDEGGGWFNTTGTDGSVVLRLKEDYDGAEPSASSVSAMNLLVLEHLVGPADEEHRVERALARLHARGPDAGRVSPLMMAALSTFHAGVSQLVIAGDPTAADTRQLRTVAASRYLPFTIVVPLAPEHRQELADRLPFTAAMGRVDRATAYLCRHFVCETPITDPETLSNALKGSRRGD